MLSKAVCRGQRPAGDRDPQGCHRPLPDPHPPPPRPSGAGGTLVPFPSGQNAVFMSETSQGSGSWETKAFALPAGLARGSRCDGALALGCSLWGARSALLLEPLRRRAAPAQGRGDGVCLPPSQVLGRRCALHSHRPATQFCYKTHVLTPGSSTQPAGPVLLCHPCHLLLAMDYRVATQPRTGTVMLQPQSRPTSKGLGGSRPGSPAMIPEALHPHGRRRPLLAEWQGH